LGLRPDPSQPTELPSKGIRPCDDFQYFVEVLTTDGGRRFTSTANRASSRECAARRLGLRPDSSETNRKVGTESQTTEIPRRRATPRRRFTRGYKPVPLRGEDHAARTAVRLRMGVCVEGLGQPYFVARMRRP